MSERSYDVEAWARNRCTVCGRFLTGTLILVGAGPIGPDRCIDHHDFD